MTQLFKRLNQAYALSLILVLSLNLIINPGYAEIINPDLLFQEAIQARDNQDYVRAEEKFRQLLDSFPENPDYHFELANLYAADYGRYEDDPENLDGRMLLDKSSHEFHQAITYKKDFVQAHYNLGIIYKKMGEYEKARESFRKVLEIDSKSIQSWLQIGEIYERQGFYEEAEDAYEKAREIDYYNPQVLGALDDLKFNRGVYQDRQQMDVQRQMRSLAIPFQRNYSSAASQIQDPYGANQNSSNVMQAVPYVASMLINQLMPRKSQDTQGY